MEVTMARHGRVAEADVIRSDVDESAAREDRARRGPIEAFTLSLNAPKTFGFEGAS
jgi:hypothetical protein